MTNERAAEILALHNAWRRGSDIPMIDPRDLGKAIELAIKALRDIDASASLGFRS